MKMPQEDSKTVCHYVHSNKHVEQRSDNTYPPNKQFRTTPPQELTTAIPLEFDPPL